MKISVAQTKPVKGNIESNIYHHKKIIELAVSYETDIIVFPELSVTGYEPALAKQLATVKDDRRFDEFQIISDSKKIIICVGMPTSADSVIYISMIIFQPGKPRQVYSKQYLHSDEEPYFVHGDRQVFLINGQHKIAPAICYELSIRGHSENAFNNGATIYMVSVAKTNSGVEKAIETLSGIAEKYSMIVLLSNSVGPSDNFIAAGKSSIWNNKGSLLAQLDDSDEGLLIFDTDTNEIIVTTLS